MRPMRTLALLLSLLSFRAYAATDLFVSMTAASRQTGQDGITRVPVNTPVAYTIHLARGGEPPATPVVFDVEVPGTIEQVIAFDDSITCTGEHPIHCVASDVSAPVFTAVTVNAQLTTPGNAVATVTITNPATDANPQNNTASYAIEVVDKPALLAGTGFGNNRLEPSQASQFTANVQNIGAPATNVTLTISLTNGGTITAVTARGGNVAFDCHLIDAVTAACHADALPYGGFFGADVAFTAPERLEGGRFRAEVVATANEDDFDPSRRTSAFESVMVRHILVTNTSDEGAGSLRQALVDATALCASEPCTIDFRIPGAGPHVIQPRTQLPDVTGVVKIDGKTQTTFGGDSDPNAPEIVIDGSLQPDGNGLVMRDGCELQIVDLAVRNFVNSAVEARRGAPNPQQCSALFATLYPSTVVSRNVLTNSNRSLVVMDTATITIEDNVMTGNRRSGIFAQRVNYLAIRRNRIENNGASGIFIDTVPSDYFIGADVEKNVIAHNAEWGIARTAKGEISVLDNSIFGNTFQGIDVSLDFETPNRGDDSVTPPNKPELFSAIYDAASNTTVVRGTVVSRNVLANDFLLQVFASTSLSAWGYPQGETLVASQHLPFSGPAGPGELTVSIEGDLRGKWITATNTRAHIIGLAKPPKVSSQNHLFAIPADTSEFSNAIQVQ